MIFKDVLMLTGFLRMIQRGTVYPIEGITFLLQVNVLYSMVSLNQTLFFKRVSSLSYSKIIIPKCVPFI